MQDTLMMILSLLLTFGITVLILRKLIPVLRSHKMGQRILDIGPRWHKSKEGTPTMGGLSFIIASALVGICGFLYLGIRNSFAGVWPLLFTLIYALLNGAIGVIDDRAKLRHKANEGLTAPQKYALQLTAAVLYLVSMRLIGAISTELAIPFTGLTVDLKWGYYPIALLLLTGVVNSVNLTDGIDGLCSSVTLLIGVFYAVTGYLLGGSGDPALLLIGALLVGSAGGFLVYNFYPARVFMGDTGSLFFGGLVVGAAFLLGSPLIIVIAGLVYIVETASVILQVLYFKLTHGKRLFKMSPIHHHFEKCGWSEIKIVVVFSVATALLCVLAYFGL